MSPDRRQQILDAALSLFLSRGYLATSIADIREASGASTGSIYHFFPGKPALALALVKRAVAGWSSAARIADDAAPEQAIKSSVRGFVRWGLANPAEARFLDTARTLADSDPGFADVSALFAQGRELGARQYAEYVAAGAVRALPWALAHALMLGPAYDYLRLVSIAPNAPDAPDLLAEAAWAAVRA